MGEVAREEEGSVFSCCGFRRPSGLGDDVLDGARLDDEGRGGSSEVDERSP